MSNRCFFCGNELIWNSDYNLSDLWDADENDDGVASFYHCPVCGRHYEIYDPPKEERENEYKEYWENDV